MARPLRLDAILVAAGPSSRLGMPKQLVEFEGESLVCRAARILSERVDGPVVTVTGCEADSVAAALDDLPARTVFNPEWKKGMGGSIACGAHHVSPAADGILVGVCDQWLLCPEDIASLVKRWRTAPGRIHAACWQEEAAQVSGPPVIFPGRLRGELKGLDKSRGARQLIDRHMDIVEFIELESASRDLDRLEDLRLLRGD